MVTDTRVSDVNWLQYIKFRMYLLGARWITFGASQSCTHAYGEEQGGEDKGDLLPSRCDYSPECPTVKKFQS